MVRILLIQQTCKWQNHCPEFWERWSYFTPNSLESINYVLGVVNQLQKEHKPDRKPNLSGRPPREAEMLSYVFCHVLAKGLLCLEEHFLDV